jgi:hypothetical protein
VEALSEVTLRFRTLIVLLEVRYGSVAVVVFPMRVSEIVNWLILVSLSQIVVSQESVVEPI